jgi:hypothetical protein
LQRTLADLKPRAGDIAAFYDAKLKGKKGLSSYTQNVGSVEEPLVGIVSESETKKHKLRVLQVERGVPEEVSYRCDDLKSGRVVVSPFSRLRVACAAGADSYRYTDPAFERCTCDAGTVIMIMHALNWRKCGWSI